MTELYNSSYCRLCSEDSNQEGVYIFKGTNSCENLSFRINKYLPVKVEDDGKLPQTICSNCHIQLHATISFFDVLAEGQKKLSQLASAEKYLTQHHSPNSNETSSSLPSLEQPFVGSSQQKRGRGRPKKDGVISAGAPVLLHTTHSAVTSPQDSLEVSKSGEGFTPETLEEQGKSRRKRKLPSRFSSTLQGKELEDVFRDVGLPEDEAKASSFPVDPMVIGKVETWRGEDLGDIMVLQAVEEVNRHQTKYRCETCNQIFTQEPKFLEHQILHAKETSALPTLNPGANSKKGNAEKKENGNDSLECDSCNKKFKHVSSLYYHKEAEHNDGRRYVCNKCPRTFKHRQLLRRHQLVHTSVRSYNCKDCGAYFKTKSILLTHQSSIHSGQKKYFCEQCGQSFAHKTSLNLHTRWHNGEKPFECHVCQKRFTQKGNLQEHIRIHTGEKPFSCEICNRQFTTSSQYNLHLKRHSGERPWSCNLCGKSFLDKSTWRCHLRRHKGEKPYDCKVCGRNFPEVWALKKHMRTHTGEKPYRCTMCDKAFSDCSNLTKHKKSHLKDRLSEEDVEADQIVYLNYIDPMNPTSEVSEKFVIENKSEQTLNDEAMLMQVMDEMGNPLKFTFQDGTQLQVTTRDGKSLEVRTADGQTIPVRLTTDSGEAIAPELTPVVIPSIGESFVDISTIELVTNGDDPETLTLQPDFLQIS